MFLREDPGLISFRMDWLDLLAVQGTLKSLLQHHSSKALILRCSAFFTVQLSAGRGARSAAAAEPSPPRGEPLAEHTPHCSTLAGNPLGRGAWWAAVHGGRKGAGRDLAPCQQPSASLKGILWSHPI